ncbi:putative reverse transcriptase domain-containing protein [Tanacetum coccineum]
MDVPLLLDHEFDFFAAEPVPGLAEAPDNQNGWIEWDVPLGGEMDEPMENPGFDDEEELNEFMDDDQDVGDEEIEEWLMAPVMPPRATVTVPSTYEVGEYRHGELVKKMVIVSDAEVTDRITIGEIHPSREPTTLEGQDTELVKESLKKAEAEMAEETSSKRAGEELEQEPTKKQKVDDDKEREYLQQCFELVTEVDVAIDAIPLATKPAPIVNFQIQRKRRNGYYEIMRADGSAKTYLLPEEGYERVLWGDLKNMFEHHIEDEVWRSLQGKKGMIVRIKSFIWLFGITAALIKVSAAQEERYLELKRKAQAKANDGGTYFFDRIWIPLVGGVRKLIMDEAHTSRYSVHPGADKMYCDLRDLYWWPEILDWKWEKITMDLVTELPKISSRYDVIWVIVDRLTKSAHFLPIHRDGQFASHLYKALQEALGTRLDMITAYHPQTDGQSISMERSGTVGKKGKLAPKYVGPFEIVEYVGPVAYRLKLPQELSCIHDTFHVSNLKKCLVESDVQVPLEEIEIDENLRFVEEPIEIVERDVKKLKRRRIPLVKVRWNS